MSQLKPSEIRYSQDSIRGIFTGAHYGKKIGETLDELVDGEISVDDIPKISVICINRKWFTYDNRRLWVFKHFELLGGCTHIPVRPTTCFDSFKFSTETEGTSIQLRQNPGGTWYRKYTSDPAKYRNYLKNQKINPYHDSFATRHSSLRLQVNHDWRYDTERTSVTPSASATGLRSSQSLYNRTETPTPTSKEASVSSLYQRYPSSIPESSWRNTTQASTLSSSTNSSITRNNSIPGESCVLLPTQRSSERVTSSSDRKTASKSNLYSASSNPVHYGERNNDMNLCRPFSTVWSSQSEKETANIKLIAQKAAPKLKPASRQPFGNIINVKQNQGNPKMPVLIMLDTSKLRYTKDTIEYPFSDERKSAIQRRLRELLQAENPKPMEVYKAYGLYWLKEENDVLWSLLKLTEDNPEWRRTDRQVKALVTEDNDAFLEFMRKEKPWLQISDIIQLGQRIDITI